jgi:hypothetical protein
MSALDSKGAAASMNREKLVPCYVFLVAFIRSETLISTIQVL